MTIPRRFVVVVLMILCSQSWAQLVPSLAVVSPSDGTVIQPGQTLAVEVKGLNLPSDGQEAVVGDVPIGISQSQAVGSDLTFQLTVPTNIQPGTYALWAGVTSSSGDTLSRSVVLKVMPNYQLTGLAFDKGILALAGPGRQSVLSAFGYSAGQRQILDNEFLSFASADPTTATVDVNGVVTAVAAGRTTVSAAYGTVSGSITVIVGSSIVGIPMTATPVISPATGSFAVPFTATITDATPGSAIHYTLDGSTPTLSSNVYGGALSIATTQTVKATAIASGYTQSPVASATYTINNPVAAPPTFNLASGTFSTAQTVLITDTTPNASIYYTANGTTPNTSSTLYTGPITVSSSQTLQAIATASGYTNSPVATATYTINIPVTATPTFSPASGTFAAVQTVLIADTTTGAAIYYTTNGTAPTTSSTLYTGPITVSSSQTLQAIATATGYTTSPVATAAYTITLPAATPTFSPTPGTFTAGQTVLISDATIGAAIYYTTNGTAPTISSTLYTGPITVSSSETLQAIAIASGYASSPIATAAYTINIPVAATPTFSPSPGTFSAAQTVTISDATTGATIYYTTNGATPTTSSTLYTRPITVSSSQTIQAIATASGYTNSPAATASYTINIPVAATPTFGPAPGIFTAAQIVSIADATAGASIYFTTNGTTPTTSSTLYTGPITVSSSQTVQAIAVAISYTTSPVASATYTINLPQDFSLSLSTTSLAVTAGQSGSLIASISPGNEFNQPVSFTCLGLPSGSACSFSPAMLTANGTAVGTTTLTVTTAAKTSLLARNRPYELAGLLAGLGLWFAGRRFRRLVRLGALLLITIGFGSFISGCGANPIAQSEPTTSVVSVNAVAGSLTHTATFSLTLK